MRHTGEFTSLERDEAAEIHSLASRAIGALAQVYAPQGFNLGWNLGRIAGAGILDHVHELTGFRDWLLLWVLPRAAGALVLMGPMRRANGYRGLHELLSGTRVVTLPQREQTALPSGR